jgi:hypothetical protein
MAATVNLRIDQGTSFSTDITVFNHTGETFDLTGFTASAKMAQGYASTRTRTIFTTTIDNDPTSGIITLKLSTTQTSALEAPKRYVFDVEIQKTSDNTVTRVIEGIITVSPSVTI